MKIADPLGLKVQLPKSVVFFAASQLQGKRETQEDFFENFNDECFVLADGVGGVPNGEIAAKLAVETAIWGYKLIRQRPFYWFDKKLFMKRIFRSTNIALWQKKRETGFEQGLATTLDVLVVGSHTFWLGHVGDSSIWFWSGKNKNLTKLTKDDTDERGYLTKVVGTERYGLIPQFVAGRFFVGDTLTMLSDGVTSAVSQQDVEKTMRECGETTDALTNAVVSLLQKAEAAGSTDNMTAILVKRVSPPVLTKFV